MSMIDKIIIGVCTFIGGTEAVFKASSEPNIALFLMQIIGGVYVVYLVIEMMRGRVFK